MHLLVATGNPGKLAEFRRLLADIALVGPMDLGLPDVEVVESGSTFRDNALLKALAYARVGACLAVADDSGLEVDALDGRPGVHSARFGGIELTDHDRCQLLLRDLDQVPYEDRTARFRCHLIVASPEGETPIEAAGTCEGRIADAASGAGGFGYDPVFHVDELGVTMAQLNAQQKNRISHRGRALAALRPPLLEAFPQLISSA